jgi:nucleoside-diphosphate-sugar epimerase
MQKEKGILLVTGSNGSIGDAVMRRFAGRFEDVVGFDRAAPTPLRPVAPPCPWTSLRTKVYGKDWA